MHNFKLVILRIKSLHTPDKLIVMSIQYDENLMFKFKKSESSKSKIIIYNNGKCKAPIIEKFQSTGMNSD